MKNNAPVILQTLPNLVSGGVERGTVEIADAIEKNGWKAIVVSNGGPMEAELARTGAKHISLPVHKRNPLAIRKNIRALEKVIRENNVSLVHARSRAPAWAAYYAAKRCGVPFVTTFHGFYGLKGLFKKRYNSVMTRGDKVIAISKFICNHIVSNYLDCPLKNIQIIHRGADISTFSPGAVSAHRLAELAKKWHIQDNHAPIILMPGRLTRWKGQHVFIDALAQIRQLDFLAILVGDDGGHPNYRDELNAQIERLDLTGKVCFVGKTKDMTEAYALSDIVVIPSIEPEAFGRVPVEAQAMGKITIAAGHGGACETVVHEETGLLVPPDDSDKLAQAIEAALTLDPVTRKHVSAAAIAHVRENFSITTMQQKTLALYEDLL